MKRRTFLSSSLCAGVSLALLRPAASLAQDPSPVDYQLTRQVPARFFDGRQCWVHARAGIVPGAGEQGAPRVVMTMNTLDLSGSDVFKAMLDLHTDDLGASWTTPRVVEPLAMRHEPIDGAERPVGLCDFWPRWHAASKTLLGTGHTVVYTPDWKVMKIRPRHTAYATYDAEHSQWSPWRKLAMPAGDKFADAGAGCTQRVDLPDGTILLPFYFRADGGRASSRVAVAHCTFDGQTLRYERHGNELGVNDDTRGLHEPSLALFDGTYYLTIRNDRTGFVTHSANGLHFEPLREWLFDDGSPLGNYNTQQHWVVHSDALHLVYTRRGADNDHVFRHRAPLFMAQVDPRRMRVLRATEQVLVPQRGARLGNFGVTDVSPNETWVTVTEWMQPEGVERYGSDGSVYVARIRWSSPNRNFQTT